MQRMRRINCIHLVGIGGVGMGGIAEVLINLGYLVQGSDLRSNSVTRRLRSICSPGPWAKATGSATVTAFPRVATGSSKRTTS